MKNRLCLLVHVTSIVKHAGALRHVLDAWDDCFDMPLFSFPMNGPGVPITDELIESRTRFRGSDELVSVVFRESRKRSVGRLEAIFLRPPTPKSQHEEEDEWVDSDFVDDELQRDHFVADLPYAWVMEDPARAEKAIVRFLAAIAKIAEVRSAAFESDDVSLKSPTVEINRSIAEAYDCVIGHIMYFNAAFVKKHGGVTALRRAGFKILAKRGSGCVASLPLVFDPPEEAAWRLFDALEKLRVFKRVNQPTHLNKHFLKVDQIGGFLGAYEARFGRTFMVPTNTGYRRPEDVP